MIFDVDEECMRPDVAGSRRVRASREVLGDVVRRPEDLRALCDIGFPQSPFRMAPPIVAPECAFERSSMVHLGDAVEIAEREFGELLLFGAVQGWYLFLHLGDGTVHAFPDEIALFPGDFRPVHSDLSSLRRLLELLYRQELSAERTYVPGATGAPSRRMERFTGEVRAEFFDADPVALSTDSLWPAFFRDIEDGLYATYCTGRRK
ncbi:SUKH-4 family immunity protein [Streptomyces sp. NBC_01433]|uniref:SUKH-4 family immunity protein n=1 Tax=Streptomyces sp. NBC_01433 TaxID=2903864 RepID=UPI00224D6231|nr:SUKH-4 family immunity protein [Streptomyces sp. NBC_01433]MCX4679628.1 SUKH-4 family immunity protein [Streptomyces sp. NBC_01433]